MTDNKMPETIYVDKHDGELYFSGYGAVEYTRTDIHEALKQSHDLVCHLLENYTFLDEGMDSSTRPEIYAESKQALAEYNALKGSAE